jgi:ankyrin repeat protein
LKWKRNMAQHRFLSFVALALCVALSSAGAATPDNQDIRQLLIKRKYAEAYALSARLAAQGDANAALLLANAYRVGLGTPQDMKSAVKWYQAAADGGNAEARKILDRLSIKPPATPLKSSGKADAPGVEGVDYSALPARAEGQPDWFTIAVARGDEKALQSLGDMKDAHIDREALPAALNVASPAVVGLVPRDVLAGTPQVILAATQSANQNLLDSVLVTKADINVSDFKGQTAVNLSARNCDAVSMLKLQQAGAKIPPDGKATPPIVQVARNCEDWGKFAKVLEASNVDAADESGRTAAWYAALRNDLTMLQWLADHGADLSIADHLGYRPLHAAAAASHPEALKFLLSKSKVANPASANGTTPVMLAAYSGCKECLAPLLQDLAEINRKNADGDTSLDFAVRGLQAYVAQTLVANGANLNARNLAGDTPQKLGERLSLVLKPGN